LILAKKHSWTIWNRTY